MVRFAGKPFQSCAYSRMGVWFADADVGSRNSKLAPPFVPADPNSSPGCGAVDAELPWPDVPEPASDALMGAVHCWEVVLASKIVDTTATNAAAGTRKNLLSIGMHPPRGHGASRMYVDVRHRLSPR